MWKNALRVDFVSGSYYYVWKHNRWELISGLWIKEWKLMHSKSGARAKIQRLELILLESKEFQRIILSLCEISGALPNLSSLSLTAAKNNVNVATRLSTHFPQLVHLSLWGTMDDLFSSPADVLRLQSSRHYFYSPRASFPHHKGGTCRRSKTCKSRYMV